MSFRALVSADSTHFCYFSRVLKYFQIPATQIRRRREDIWLLRVYPGFRPDRRIIQTNRNFDIGFSSFRVAFDCRCNDVWFRSNRGVFLFGNRGVFLFAIMRYLLYRPHVRVCVNVSRNLTRKWVLFAYPGWSGYGLDDKLSSTHRTSRWHLGKWQNQPRGQERKCVARSGYFTGWIPDR